jgi:hypothetical protein
MTEADRPIRQVLQEVDKPLLARGIVSGAHAVADLKRHNGMPMVFDQNHLKTVR